MSHASIECHALTWTPPDGRRLIDGLTLHIGPGRTGLVGRNGSGKTTLLRLIAGDLSPTSGSVTVIGRLAWLRQQSTPPGPSACVADGLGIAPGLTRLARIEAGRPEADDLDTADWTLPDRAQAALETMGLTDPALDAPLALLSGGERTRVHLAGLLMDRPDGLLLDEPTNNLDADGRAAVHDLLTQWPGLALVVSHDRALMRRMDRIVELSGLGARVYGGNFDLYRERKAAERAAADQALQEAERTLDRTEREIQAARERKDRADGRGRAARAKGGDPKMALDAAKQRSENSTSAARSLEARKRAEALQGLQDARSAVEIITPLTIAAPATGLAHAKRLVRLDQVSWRTPDGRTVLDRVSLDVTGAARIAVTGPNGAGKSTLLRLITGDLDPAAGTVERFVPVRLLDQSVGLLDGAQTILGAVHRLCPGLGDTAAHALLARFAFRNTDALKPIRLLSGGERLRAGLAVTLGAPEPPPLLLLDEPTNHLDLDSIALLEAALQAYDGALLVVSHDTDFLAAIGVDRTAAL